MEWKLIEFATSAVNVRCCLCMEDMPPAESKVRLNPVKDTPKFFYYYHRTCFTEQLKALRGQ